MISPDKQSMEVNADGRLQIDSETDSISVTVQAKALETIEQLIRYAKAKGMLGAMDCPYARNALLDLFQLSEPASGFLTLYEDTANVPDEPHDLLKQLLDYGSAIGLIPDNTDTQRDLMDARIMGLLMPRPSEVERLFHKTAEQYGMEPATSQFYDLNLNSHYIRMDRVRQNDEWEYNSEYGTIQLTINVSKPEKSPQEIMLARQLPASSYPQCLLCADNVGYPGHLNHPARQNLRILTLMLNAEDWYFQYSPYVYYNEHSIVFRREHVPMQLTKATFKRLLSFTEQFPHYFIGSNADLPIVGGSILSHDHFQAGRHTFPIEHAPKEQSYVYPSYEGVQVSIIRWPMSVLRLESEDRDMLLQAVNAVFEAWKQYSDPEAGIYAYTIEDGERISHNTVTPIVRRRGDKFEADVVLRNNLTSEEHPEGIYHPHREMHHIKKENIGLIEVMGLAILPARLQQSISQIKKLMTGEVCWQTRKFQLDESDSLYAHREWIEELIGQHGNQLSSEEAEYVLKQDIGRLFVEILGHAGVYKRNEAGQAAFRTFAESLGLQ